MDILCDKCAQPATSFHHWVERQWVIATCDRHRPCSAYLVVEMPVEEYVLRKVHDG